MVWTPHLAAVPEVGCTAGRGKRDELVERGLVHTDTVHNCSLSLTSEEEAGRSSEEEEEEVGHSSLGRCIVNSSGAWPKLLLYICLHFLVILRNLSESFFMETFIF